MKATHFDAAKETAHIVRWIRNYAAKTMPPEAKAVIGISGGKDSTILAALLVKALGKDRVYGVLMPDGPQKDLATAINVVEYLGIEASLVNIQNVSDAGFMAMRSAVNPRNPTELKPIDVTSDVRINLPPRLRMAMLYAAAQSLPSGGRVVNTCNASEDYVGYSTKFGDGAGDFAPLQDYTVTEIRAIGQHLGLPPGFVFKTPSDGLCGQTDEEKLGFTYAVLDRYVRTGICEDPAVRKRIDALHEANLHKLRPMPFCPRRGRITTDVGKAAASVAVATALAVVAACAGRNAA